MKTTHLNLFVPEWQGYGVDQSPGIGARVLKQQLFADTEFFEPTIDQNEQLVVENSIVGYSAVLANLMSIRRALDDTEPESTFVLGGTCAIEVLPVTYLNKLYNGDLAVIWFDAHADLNTPDSSPSGHFHGMPLRTIVGEGEPQICQLAYSRLDASQVFLLGARDLDPAEEQFVSQSSVEKLDVDVTAEQLCKSIKQRGFSNAYVHFDLDVLNPAEFSEMIFQVAEGMSLDHSLHLVESIGRELNVVGSSLLEFVSSGSIQHTGYLNQLSAALRTSFAQAR